MALEPIDLREARWAAKDRPAAKRTLTPANMQAVLAGGSASYGGFGAAKPGRLTADWNRTPRSADQQLIVDLRFLRARAREQRINSPIAAKFTQMLRTNLVGPHGIRTAFKVEKLRQRNDEVLDDDVNEALDKAWRKWQRREYCTVHGKYTFADVCRMAADGLGGEGDFIVRKVPVSKSDNPFGFSLQLINADQLDDNLNQIGSATANQIRMGVEVNQFQKPLFYHIFPGNPYEFGFGRGVRQRVPSDQIYHIHIPRFVGQTRGYPLLAPVMWDMKMLDGYFEAELVAARIGATIIAAIEQSNEGTYNGVPGDGETRDGSTKVDIGYGTALQLGPGQKLNNASPEHPTAAFSPFVERSLRLISSGLGVAYFELGNDHSGINFSSGRLGIIEQRDFYMELQQVLVDSFVRPVYEDWVKYALLNGALALPFDADRYTDQDAVEFIPRRWTWLDPLKDVQAAVDEVQNGFATHDEKLHQQGKDWRKVFKQLKVEQDLANSLGIQIGTDIRGDALSEVNDGAPDETGEPGTDSKPAKETPAAPPKKKPKS
jgi:lambda family phage portal protein